MSSHPDECAYKWQLERELPFSKPCKLSSRHGSLPSSVPIRWQQVSIREAQGTISVSFYLLMRIWNLSSYPWAVAWRWRFRTGPSSRRNLWMCCPWGHLALCYYHVSARMSASPLPTPSLSTVILRHLHWTRESSIVAVCLSFPTQVSGLPNSSFRYLVLAAG